MNSLLRFLFYHSTRRTTRQDCRLPSIYLYMEHKNDFDAANRQKLNAAKWATIVRFLLFRWLFQIGFFSKIVLFKFCHWGLYLKRLQHFPFNEEIEEIPSGERCVERKPVIYSTNTYFMLKYQTQYIYVLLSIIARHDLTTMSKILNGFITTAEYL